MIEPPHVATTAAQHTAVVRLLVPRADIATVMGPGIRESLAAVAAQGVAPTGPWFTHHFRRPTDTFDFELGVPVPSPVAPAGRVAPGHRPALTVARTVYHGPYEGLAAAWGEFCGWVEANGHTPADDLWETYLVGPETSADPADWRTELARPLLAASGSGNVTG